MKQQYSFAYFPPMPVLPIAFSFPDRDQWHGPMFAIVDTGADFTIVPISVVQLLNLPIVGDANLVSQWQDRRAVLVYQTDIQIGTEHIFSVEIAGDPESNEVILGRNVLNELDLHLDGPALQCELVESILE
jgi:predicted aspartyl protease